jgi:hypothetical protein
MDKKLINILCAIFVTLLVFVNTVIITYSIGYDNGGNDITKYLVYRLGKLKEKQDSSHLELQFHKCDGVLIYKVNY